MKDYLLHRRRPVLVVLGLAAVLTLTFVLALAENKNNAAPDSDQRHRHDYAELAKIPEKARVRRNPLEADPQAVEAGRKLFQRHCAECHGEAADGGHKAPSLRAEEVRNATPGELFWILTNGVVRRGMPVWSKLPEPQRWQIVSFLRTLGSEPGR